MILPGIYEMCSSVTSPSALYTRAIVIVLDSVGVGELPDAASYGDRGSNTVGNIAKRIPLKLPTLRSLGFDRIASIGASVARSGFFRVFRVLRVFVVQVFVSACSAVTTWETYAA